MKYLLSNNSVPTFLVVATISMPLWAGLNDSANQSKTHMVERDYVALHCQGETEHVLPDRTRIDCLTDEVAAEYDWDYKWQPALGQSLHYATMTGKRPHIVLISTSHLTDKYVKSLEAIKRAYRLDLTIEVIYPDQFK